MPSKVTYDPRHNREKYKYLLAMKYVNILIKCYSAEKFSADENETWQRIYDVKEMRVAYFKD